MTILLLFRRVTVSAKTTCKHTRETRRRRFVFQPTREGSTVGTSSEADMMIDDPNMAAIHGRVSLREDGGVMLETLGRTYELIGQGNRSSGLYQLHKGQVVKMGACSLLISDLRVSRDPQAAWKCVQEPVTAPSRPSTSRTFHSRHGILLHGALFAPLTASCPLVLADDRKRRTGMSQLATSVSAAIRRTETS